VFRRRVGAACTLCRESCLLVLLVLLVLYRSSMLRRESLVFADHVRLSSGYSNRTVHGSLPELCEANAGHRAQFPRRPFTHCRVDAIARSAASAPADRGPPVQPSRTVPLTAPRRRRA
jgi:hypothetical protein